MAQLIPLSNDARQTFRCVLGSQSVRVRAWWQPLDGYWYLSLATLARTPIISAVRLVEGARPFSGAVLEFTGGLLVSGPGEVGRNAWTTTHRLLYLDATETAADAVLRHGAALREQ